MSALQCLCQILNATSLGSRILGFMITHAPVVFPLRLLIPAGQFCANHRVRTKKIPCNNTHFKLIWKSLYVTREPLHEYWCLYACVYMRWYWWTFVWLCAASFQCTYVPCLLMLFQCFFSTPSQTHPWRVCVRCFILHFVRLPNFWHKTLLCLL